MSEEFWKGAESEMDAVGGCCHGCLSRDLRIRMKNWGLHGWRMACWAELLRERLGIFLELTVLVYLKIEVGIGILEATCIS
jgi:hypothetical protein